MSKENVELIRDMYAALNAHDVQGVLSRMAPDIVWNEAENFPYSDHNTYVGPAAVARGVFARGFTEWNGFDVAIEEILDAGDTVIGLGRYCGEYKATGKSMRTQTAHIWRVKDGKAVQFQQYADTLQTYRVMHGD
jgi:hypothetical protein